MNKNQPRVGYFNCLNCGIIAEYYYHEQGVSIEPCTRCDYAAFNLLPVTVKAGI